MGACCSCHRGGHFEGYFVEEEEAGKGRRVEEDEDDDAVIFRGDAGARVRLQGSSKYVSMFTQQGRKGVNQDSMTVWEVTFYIITLSFPALLTFFHSFHHHYFFSFSFFYVFDIDS